MDLLSGPPTTGPRTLSARTPRPPTRMTVVSNDRLSRKPTESDEFEFCHDPIESLTSKLAAAYGGTKVGPIQELRACRCQPRGGALNKAPSRTSYRGYRV